MNMRTRSPYSRNNDLYQSLDRSVNSKYSSITKKEAPKVDKSAHNFSTVDEKREKSRNMILESTMERKNLKDSIMRRYKDSNARVDSRSREQDSLKKSSLYQTFIEKKVSVGNKPKSDAKNWASTESASWNQGSKMGEKSNVVDRLLSSTAGSAFKTEQS